MNSCICHATHYRDEDGLTSQAGTTKRLGQTPKEVRATRTHATNYRERACEIHRPLTSKPAVRLPLNVPISNEVEFQAGVSTRDAVRELRIFDETRKHSIHNEIALLRRTLYHHRTEAELNRERLKRIVNRMRSDFATRMNMQQDCWQSPWPLWLQKLQVPPRARLSMPISGDIQNTLRFVKAARARGGAHIIMKHHRQGVSSSEPKGVQKRRRTTRNLRNKAKKKNTKKKTGKRSRKSNNEPEASQSAPVNNTEGTWTRRKRLSQKRRRSACKRKHAEKRSRSRMTQEQKEFDATLGI